VSATAEIKQYTTLEELGGRIAYLQDSMHDLYESKGIEAFTLDDIKTVRAAEAEMTDLGKRRDELKANADAVEAMRARIIEEQRPQRGVIYPGAQNGAVTANNARPDWQKSIGQLVVESAAVQQYSRAAKRGPAVEMDVAWLLTGNAAMAPEQVKESKAFREAFGAAEFKALLDTTGYPIQSVRLPGVAANVPFRTPMVQQLIPSSTTNAPAVPYLEETTATNAAAAVAEGAAKPEATLLFTDRTAPVRKIAVALPVTDEALDDAPGLQGYIDNRLSQFLRLEWERQLLAGNGTPPNLTGILATGGIQTQAKGADPTPDAVYKAMQKIRTVAYLEPSAVVMHPDDWTDIRLLRSTDGHYLFGDPGLAGEERLFSLPVRQTTAMTANTALVGAFDQASQQFIRQGVSFSMSTEHSTFFIENKVMLLVEMRLAHPVFRPAGYCTVTGV
jgi:HK97 family phage major capsid protein